MASDTTVNHAYAVILAGGSGTRFWPASRRQRPKQLLEGIFGPRTLLERTVARLDSLIPPERIYVFTNTLLKKKIESLFPQIPPGQIVAEPAARNTAPTLGLGAHEILRRDPAGMMVILPSDHLIARPVIFRQVLHAALRWADTEGRSLLVGLKPVSAHTGFGYIRKAGLAGEIQGQKIYRVESFKEKPSAAVAKRYIASGNYLWNGGMFVWRASTLIANLVRFKPKMARGLDRIAKAGGAASTKVLNRIYPKLEKISIDYAVAEKANDVFAVAADFGWSDVGSWSELYALRPKDAEGNVRPRHSFCLNAHGNLIVSDKFVAAVGVRDLIIVQTPDAILVADRHQAQEVGKAVAGMDTKQWKGLV
ncbi:MAG TPA: sugar phosphate nucleotidyltransferase [Terriglobia bacterium]